MRQTPSGVSHAPTTCMIETVGGWSSRGGGTRIMPSVEAACTSREGPLMVRGVSTEQCRKGLTADLTYSRDLQRPFVPIRLIEQRAESAGARLRPG